MIMNLKWNKISLIIIILSLLFILYKEIGNKNRTLDLYLYNKKYIKHKRLELYFSEFLCHLLVINDKNNCKKQLIIDYNFFYYDIAIENNINLYIDNNISFIENLLILIGLVPFLKHNSTLEFKINNEIAKQLFQEKFNYKSIKNSSYTFYISDLEVIKNKLNDLIDYIWEFLPSKKILDIIRYIINNYYDDSCNEIFEEVLNKNYAYFIQHNNNNLSNKAKEKLMSK